MFLPRGDNLKRPVRHFPASHFFYLSLSLTLIQLDQPVGVRETVNKHYFSRDEGRALMAYQRLLDERRGMHFLVSVLQGDRRPAEVETFALQRFFWVKKVLSVVPTCLLNLGNGLLTDIS
ncbi:hypothetical protein PGTUg99_029985 [Puccinia graminis f. sp. tritici]|uniref:Uncharacterized protein n=1 Tax=Puccinia graminis f. sp. tritici TaxID=56615 RepID=A0A5B0RW64_PUCGR|nr:hypothetical protein PGTUg99_029985 [Puccinia graminis f. sp. tritici]